MIEIRHLSHAIALAEHRNFARAAKALHMSQPALTRNIQALEERVGIPLFERMRSGVEPTDAGLLLLKRAKAILGQTDDLMREIGGLGTGYQEEIRLAAGPYAAGSIVGPTVAAMLNQRPGLRFRLTVDHWVNTIRKLRERRVDFALCEASEVSNPDLVVIPMLRHPARPVVRQGHPILKAEVTTMKQVLQWPVAITSRLPPRILSKLVPASETNGGYEPTVHCEDVGLLKTLVSESDVVGLFPLAMVEEDLVSDRMVALEVEEPWLATEFALFYLKDRSLSAVGAEFIDELRKADERLALKNQQLAEFVLRRPMKIAKGRKSATSKAK